MMLRPRTILLVLSAFFVTSSTAHQQQEQPPNIVFLVCESTDGRTWRRGYQDDVIPLPNMRTLEDMGAYSFYRHYSNTPVCCPSRASFWSGRHPHKIPHLHDDHPVDGVWNNYEGLPKEYQDSIFQVLERNGYDTFLSGKEDYVAGGHSLTVRLNAWTMYTRFPYDIPENGGWNEENDVCRINGTVHPDTGTESNYWKDDWKNVNETINWIQNHTKRNQTKPFFAYQGMNIVHPAYVTNQRYFSSIDPNKIRVPSWSSLEDLHPCDLQSIMLKGCLPLSANSSDAFYSKERRRRIRRIYYAMISEFDAMVGAYLKAVREAGVWNNTIFIVTSDHGDMQMEHQQHYKMVPYDASSSVPMLIYDPRTMRRNNEGEHVQPNVVRTPTQHIDLFPTIMELAGVQKDIPKGLDGYSLLPMMNPYFDQSERESISRILRGATDFTKRPDFVVSQYHGDNTAMSWFFIVRPMPCRLQFGKKNPTATCIMKLIVWGTGKEVDSQLFDLTHDPDENINLIHSPDYVSIVASLDASLRSVVDYETVAMDVARYNKESFVRWINRTVDWKEVVQGVNLRWHESWQEAGEGAMDAIQEWLSKPASVVACRKDWVWPPAQREERNKG